MSNWELCPEHAATMYLYLVHGLSPGSFFTAILANDFFGAVSHSHPSNTMLSLKNLVGWLNSELPREAAGSYAAVENWGKLSVAERRAKLEQHNIIYTEQDEMWMTLRGDRVSIPQQYERQFDADLFYK